MAIPDSYDDVVEWFARTHDEALLRQLLDGMQLRPAQYDGAMTPAKAWNMIHDRGFLFRHAKIGWLRPDGVMLGTNWASHERLLHYFGFEAFQVEQMGWARISQRDYKCLYRLTPQQIATVKRIGLPIDDGEERLKPRI